MAYDWINKKYTVLAGQYSLLKNGYERNGRRTFSDTYQLKYVHDKYIQLFSNLGTYLIFLYILQGEHPLEACFIFSDHLKISFT